MNVKYFTSKNPDAWVGFDLDGTLANDEPGQAYDPLRIGEPIPRTVQRARDLLADGMNIRIVTARAMPKGNKQIPQFEVIYAIEQWCLTHLGQIVPVVACKDYDMLALYDDRAIQVERNTGELSTEIAYQKGVEDGYAQRM
jgi:hypothetical protein